nr:hypothetical protein Iba_chr15bCG0950 [Ipomoea batatas]GMD99077.1 hypothetical protein Iba_chr15eCG0320 [Ipomoea batatas]GMD99889.1 hypothetical protein Iba_chr15fCG0120 [Ipomoea batatas]
MSISEQLNASLLPSTLSCSNMSNDRSLKSRLKNNCTCSSHKLQSTIAFLSSETITGDDT